MHQRLTALLVVAVAALPGARPTHAQTGAPLPPARFGIVAGANSSTLAGADVGPDDDERRSGLVAGVYLTLPLGSVLAVQPELLYSMKGADAGAGDDAAAFRSDYVEVPLLLRADLPMVGVLPYLFAGPTFAYRVRCELGAGTGAASETIDCDDLADAQPGEDTPEFKKFDLGVAVGGGVAFRAGGAALNLGLRYTFGTSSIVDPGTVRNRVLSVTAGLEFPFGRR